MMHRLFVAGIAVGLSLIFSACESQSMSTSSDRPDLTGINQGDPGWTDQGAQGSGMATEDHR
jgi:hypothetical protein